MGEPNRPADRPQQQSDAEGDPRESAKSGGDGRSLLRRFGLAIFGAVTALLVRAIGATWRLEQLGSDPRRDPNREHSETAEPGQLAAFFHESLLPAAWYYRDRRYTAAVSRSRDGDLVGATLQALGYAAPARGSSSRGGSAALRGLLRHLDRGTTVSVLVDGPRGPAHVSKPGIIALARMADRPIQPVAFAASPAIRLRSWDRSLIPLPFARVVCAYGEPLPVPQGGEGPPSTEEEEAHARQLDQHLEALARKAEAQLS